MDTVSESLGKRVCGGALIPACSPCASGRALGRQTTDACLLQMEASPPSLHAPQHGLRHRERPLCLRCVLRPLMAQRLHPRPPLSRLTLGRQWCGHSEFESQLQGHLSLRPLRCHQPSGQQCQQSQGSGLRCGNPQDSLHQRLCHVCALMALPVPARSHSSEWSESPAHPLIPRGHRPPQTVRHEKAL